MALMYPRSLPRRYLCGTCQEQCTQNRIFCDLCVTWLHTFCEQLSENDVKKFEELPADVPYICKKCRSCDDDSFDFDKAFTRLHKGALQGFKKLQGCVKREQLFLSKNFVGPAGMGSLAVDTAAQDLLSTFMPGDKGIPVCNMPDSQSAFRAVSLAISANETLALELQVRCCLEMVGFESYHRWQNNYPLLAAHAPDYIDSCLDCVIPGEAASVWTLSALASVIQRPLISVYPKVNGPADPAVVALNTTFFPRESSLVLHPIRLMWTSSSKVIPIQGRWTPDHFVPLFDPQTSAASEQTSKNKRGRQKRRTKETVQGQSPESHENATDTAEDALDSSHNSINPQETEAELPAQAGYSLEYGKFMTVFEAFEKITTTTEVLESIPKGRKENVCYVIDNSYNVQHPEKRNFFYDDCGVWDSQHGTCAKSHFILQENGDLRNVKLNCGYFCQLKKSCGNTSLVQLDPQPDIDKVIICNRYYSFLKRDKNYKRRFTWFTLPPTIKNGHEVALVEYLGKYPGPSLNHANSKTGRGAYVRTDPKLMNLIAEQIKAGGNVTPGKLFREICKSLGPGNTLREPRQISNMKYLVKQKLLKAQKAANISKQEPMDTTDEQTDKVPAAVECMRSFFKTEKSDTSPSKSAQEISIEHIPIMMDTSYSMETASIQESHDTIASTIAQLIEHSDSTNGQVSVAVMESQEDMLQGNCDTQTIIIHNLSSTDSKALMEEIVRIQC